MAEWVTLVWQLGLFAALIVTVFVRMSWCWSEDQQRLDTLSWVGKQIDAEREEADHDTGTIRHRSATPPLTWTLTHFAITSPAADVATTGS